MTTEAVDYFYFDQDSMKVKDFITRDRDIISYFKDFIELPEIQQKFENVLKIGVIVTTSVDVFSKVDYVKKEVNTMSAEFKEKLAKWFIDIGKVFEEALGGQGTFSTVMEEYFGNNGRIEKLLDPNKPGMPLYHMISKVEEMNILLREKKVMDEFKQKTTQKGFAFEQHCENILNDITRINGDSLEKTSHKVGSIPNCRKGDYVITLGNNVGKKLVMELKDVDKRFTTEDIQQELDEAKKNRGADYGVFIVKNVESTPKSSGWFQELNGSNLVCALGKSDSDGDLHIEILRIACNWTKSRLLERALKEKKIDVTFVSQQIETLKFKLHAFSDVIVQCSNIRKSITEIQRIVETSEREINQGLNRIINSIAPSTNDDSDK